MLFKFLQVSDYLIKVRPCESIHCSCRAIFLLMTVGILIVSLVVYVILLGILSEIYYRSKWNWDDWYNWHKGRVHYPKLTRDDIYFYVFVWHLIALFLIVLTNIIIETWNVPL